MDTQAPTRISAPVINPTAWDRLQHLINRTMAPHSVESILQSAINGDLRDQGLVFLAMMDTWPRLQKCINEVAGAVASAPLTLEPFSLRGDDATDSAIEAAASVEAALKSLTPDPTRSHECDFEGLLERMTHGYYAGHSVSEIYYYPNESPRAFRVFDSRYYSYPRDQRSEDRLMLNPSGHYNGHLEDFSNYPGRFLVGINCGHLGHASVSAPLRSLVQWWMASHFGLKWMLEFAQTFGTPIRWATYPNGDNCAMNAVSEMLDTMGLLGWGAFPEGTNLDVKESSKSAGDLPQKALIEMADRQVDIAILGQSLTTDVADSGSRALGDVHANVRKDAINAVANWALRVLNSQLIPALLPENGLELPRFKLNWPEISDEKALAERDEILLARMNLPVSKSWLYGRHNVPEPAEGEELFSIAPPTPEPEAEPTPEPEAEPAAVEAQQASGGRMVMNRPVVDQLTDAVMESVSGEAAVFLAGVRPTFRRLVATALDGSISDADFIATLDSVALSIPEMRSELNTESLQRALEEAIGSGMLAGAGERVISR